MAAPIHQEVTIPAPLRHLADHLIVRFGDDALHIERGAELVALGHVTPPSVGYTWQVRSACHATTIYQTTTYTCTCPDAQQRARRCKHRYAVILYVAAEDERRYEALVASERVVLTPKGYAALGKRPPAPTAYEWAIMCSRVRAAYGGDDAA